MDSQSIQEQQQRDIQTIQTINQIDSQMGSLYQNLEQLSVQSRPDLNEQNKIIKGIEKLQKLKQNLYKNLSNSYSAIQANVAESRDALVNKLAVSNVVNNELENANKNLNVLQQERYNKLRMAEINDYYSDKYATQTNIMKTIVYFCIPILILGILMKKNIIPQNIALGIIGLLAGICVFIVIMQGIDIMRRSNMVFDEYKFSFDEDAAADEVANQSEDEDEDEDENQPVKRDLILNCAGSGCCPEGNDFGTIWDSTNKQCVTQDYLDSHKDDDNTTSEGFVGERCLQNSFNKSDFNVNVFKNTESVVKGFNIKQEEYAKF
jgi:hypothetical protein